jgi:hypothetical protein
MFYFPVMPTDEKIQQHRRAMIAITNFYPTFTDDNKWVFGWTNNT